MVEHLLSTEKDEAPGPVQSDQFDVTEIPQFLLTRATGHSRPVPAICVPLQAWSWNTHDLGHLPSARLESHSSDGSHV